jgi:hypothetical protein
MATKQEWQDYFKLINDREPTLAEFEAAKANGEITDESTSVQAQTESAFCQRCGLPLAAGATFCPACGAQQKQIIYDYGYNPYVKKKMGAGRVFALIGAIVLTLFCISEGLVPFLGLGSIISPFSNPLALLVPAWQGGFYWYAFLLVLVALAWVGFALSRKLAGQLICLILGIFVALNQFIATFITQIKFPGVHFDFLRVDSSLFLDIAIGALFILAFFLKPKKP